jgi:hypothetical protein
MQMKNKNQVGMNLVSIASVLLVNMTREELRRTAIALNVKRGRNRMNTIDNLLAAIEEGSVGLKAECTICKPPVAPATYSVPVFKAKLRTYKVPRVLQSPAPIFNAPVPSPVKPVPAASSLFTPSVPA